MPLSVVTRINAAVLTAARLHEGMIKIARVGYHLAQHAVHQLRIRPPGHRRLLGAAIFACATFSMALVICAVFLTETIRRRMSRVLGI